MSNGLTSTPADYATNLRARAARAALSADDFSPPDSRFVTLGARLQFHYLDWGGAGAPVLLLHGGGLNAHTWDMCCLVLRAGFRCLALDLRGHGDSDWASDGDYAIARHGGDVEAFLDALGIEETALVGMSLGGLASIEAATALKQRLKALALVDVVPRLPPRHAADAIGAFHNISAFANLDEAVQHALAFNPRRTAEGLRQSLSRSLKALPDGRLTWKHDSGRVRPDREALAQIAEHLWAIAKGIECPVLVVRGAESPVIRREDAEAFVANLHDGKLVEVADAGHTVQGDNPKGLLKELEPFLRSRYHLSPA